MARNIGRGHIHYQKMCWDCLSPWYRYGAFLTWPDGTSARIQRLLGSLQVIPITFVYDGVIRPDRLAIGHEVRTIFVDGSVLLFILYMNLLGLIVVFPAARILTGAT